MAVEVKLDDETRGILSRMTIDGLVAKLPPGQLDRPVYDKVNKALTALGGKWNRGKAGHVFPVDPTPLLHGGVETGAVENKKQKFQFFETPVSLATDMVVALNLPKGARILEPSAGRGRLMFAANSAGYLVGGYELDPDNVRYLEDNSMTISEADFLIVEPFEVDGVLMNPPFAKKQGIAHIRHAWKFLKSGGTMVAICDAGAMSNTGKIEKEFQKWLESVHADIKCLPAGTFKDSGTNVVSYMLTIKKD